VKAEVESGAAAHWAKPYGTPPVMFRSSTATGILEKVFADVQDSPILGEISILAGRRGLAGLPVSPSTAARRARFAHRRFADPLPWRDLGCCAENSS
jgi:hypothetical protein